MKRWILILVPLVALLGFIGWRITQKNAEAAQQKAERVNRGKAALLVEVAQVKRGDIVKTLDAVGSAEADKSVDISPKVGGRLIFLPVREGDRVQKGQILARLDPAEVNADVAQKQAALAQAQQRLSEAQLTQRPTEVALSSDIRRQQAALTSAQAQNTQASADYAAQIAQAQAGLNDANSKIVAASAQIAQDEAAIATARANLKNAEVKLERQTLLFNEGATAKQNVDDAQTVVEVARAAVREAEQKRAASVAARNSAEAQKVSAQKNVSVVRNQASASRATAKANVNQAQATLLSSQANTSRKPAYEANLKALSAIAMAAQADVQAAQARKNDTVLASPLTGIVTGRPVDVGAFVPPGQTIISVQTVQPILVSIGVPEELSGKVFIGQSAQITFDGLPGGKPVTGKVAEYVPAADTQSRQFTLRLRVDNASGSIRPGMFAHVRIATDTSRNALLVPLEAVQKSQNEKAASVAVVKNGQVALTDVKTGLSDGKNIAVTGGLEDGTNVVILSGRSVKDGQKVRVAEDNKTSSPKAARSEGSLR